MARFYQVRERVGDHRFDMTVKSDDEGWCHAIGYCAGWQDLSTEEDYRKAYPWAGKEMLENFRLDHEKLVPFKDKYHKAGHATREEALACYRDFELDHELRFFQLAKEQRQCEVCGTWSQGGAELGECTWIYVCPEHANRQGVEQVLSKKKV